MRGAGRGGEKAEEQESADRLTCLGGDETEECEEPEPEYADGHPLGRGDRRVEGCVEERPCDREQQRAREEREQDRRSDGSGVEPEDRAEEDAHASGSVARAVPTGEDREEEDAEAEGPREERADGDVVRASTVSEKAQDDSAENRHDEEPGEGVEAEHGRCERAREGDVAQGVAGEDLRSQDDEVADQAAGDCHEGAGDERVAHELVGQHHATSGANRAVARRRPTAPRLSRTRT